MSCLCSVVDNKILLFLATYGFRTSCTTTALVSATPPSQAPVWPLVFCIHFLFLLSSFTQIFYDDGKGTASPPDHLSYLSSAIGRTAWLGFTRFGRKFVVHFCRVHRYLLCSAIMVCLMGRTAVQTYVAAGFFWWLRPRSAWLGVVGLKRTWDQMLSSASMLVMLVTIHVFQFYFAGTEHSCLVKLHIILEHRFWPSVLRDVGFF